MRAQLGGRWGVAILVIVAAVAVVSVVGATGMGDEPTGEEILNDTRERYANADTVVGSADVTVANGTENATATVEYVAAGNKSRVVIEGENETYRAGSNGRVVWHVGPNRTGTWELDAVGQHESAIHRTVDMKRPAAVPNQTTTGEDAVSVEVIRSGSDDGVEAHVLRVTPENESIDGQATLWIAKSDSRLLRAEATDGKNTTVVDYRDTRFNVSVHESTFDPPTDRIAETSFERYGDFTSAQAATSLDLPRLDAHFREAVIRQQAEETGVVQQYVVDEDNVTVVSTTSDRSFDRSDENETVVTVNGHEATVTTIRGTAVVYWRTDGVTTAVIVEANEDRAVELASRLDE